MGECASRAIHPSREPKQKARHLGSEMTSGAISWQAHEALPCPPGSTSIRWHVPLHPTSERLPLSHGSITLYQATSPAWTIATAPIVSFKLTQDLSY